MLSKCTLVFYLLLLYECPPGPDRVRGPDEVGDGADFCPGVQFGDGAGIEIWGSGRGREVPTRPAPPRCH